MVLLLLFVGVSLGVIIFGPLAFEFGAEHERQQQVAEEEGKVTQATIRRYWTALGLGLLLLGAPRASWAVEVAFPATLCAVGGAADVWSFEHVRGTTSTPGVQGGVPGTYTTTVYETNPTGPNLGVRIGLTAVACAADVWADTLIQRSAHPHRAWILRGLVAGFAVWKVTNNLNVRRFP